MNKQIIHYNNNLYILNKVLTCIKEPPIELINELKTFYNSETTLKKNDKYYFVTPIIEILNYGPENENDPSN